MPGIVAGMILCCIKCGAKAKPGCECEAAYIPARMYAAKAIAAHPEKSDRAIAKDIGVDHKTVAKARKAVGDKSPTRVGTDGKRYRATKQITPELAKAMQARAEAVARLFPPPVATIPASVRAELIRALKRIDDPLVETIRKRLNLTWDDLIVPAIVENAKAA
jgi:hypothetical protein